jgi:hypothetical protein
LTDAQILEVVHRKVSDLIGVDGEWTVSRRSPGDTDAFFHSVLAQSVSVGIAAAISDARRRVEEGETASEPQHLAARDGDVAQPRVQDDAVTAPEAIDAAAGESASRDVDATEPAVDQPVAFSWEPAPITVWADLRRPVTGPVQTIPERSAA